MRIGRVAARLLPGVAAPLLLIAGATPAAAAGPEARILTRGDPYPGAEIRVQVEVSWDGRPEDYAPTVPALRVPDGAGLTLGRTGNSFDGAHAKWWTNADVILPESPGPWDIGPANVRVAIRDGDVITVEAPARRVGGRRVDRNLLGQALGSALVLTLAGAWLTWRWRSLPPDPPPPAAPTP